ncbi:MAG: hypothetical protein K6C98_04240 [Treponema sp.]|nr:hypothetical protein [Treponema sp.]
MLKKGLLAGLATMFVLSTGVFLTSCANGSSDDSDYIAPVNEASDNSRTTPAIHLYSVDADLSCWISAMGGQEFGKPVYKGITIVKDSDGSYSAVLSLGKGKGNIYGIEFDAFIDSRISVPGFYNAEGKVVNAEFLVSKDDTASAAENPYYNQEAEEVHYVTAMKIPVSESVSEYTLWLYVNSNIMGCQFGDGKGDASSNEPGKESKFTGKLTIDWATLKAADVTLPEFANIKSIYGNSYTFGKAGHALTINSDKSVTYSMGMAGSYAGTWTADTLDENKNIADFNFAFTKKDGAEIARPMEMSWKIRVLSDDNIELINTTRNTTTLAKKVTL